MKSFYYIFTATSELMEQYRIVWVDDDKDDLEVFKEILKELQIDHKLVEFHNGKEVLDHLNTLQETDFPCLIVLDMNMPVLDGRRTLSQIKSQQRYNQIPIVIFTTSDSVLDK